MLNLFWEKFKVQGYQFTADRDSISQYDYIEILLQGEKGLVVDTLRLLVELKSDTLSVTGKVLAKKTEGKKIFVEAERFVNFCAKFRGMILEAILATWNSINIRYNHIVFVTKNEKYLYTGAKPEIIRLKQ